MARILCVWSPIWAIANWRRRNPSASPAEPARGEPAKGLAANDHGPAAAARPFALLATERGVRRLTAVDDRAAALGLFAGQKATDAAALAPDLITADAEPEADAAALEALADWCVRFSPAVALDPPDGLFLDISGVDHLWGGEAAMLTDLRQRLAWNGLPIRAAIADTPGAAWALARFTETGTIAAPGRSWPLLARLPVQALRLEPQAAAQIGRLGLLTVERLARLPRDQITRRFGRQVVLRLDQALGRTEEALSFRRPATPWFARLAFAEPISAPDDLARASRDIAVQLCARLEAQGRGGRRFELAFHRLDGKALRLTIGLSLPGRDAVRIARLFAPMLETVDPGFGLEAVTLAAAEVEAVSERQARLDAGREVAPEEGLAPLADRLTNRLGEDRIWRTEPFPSHLPERAVERRPPLAPVRPAAPALGVQAGAGGWDPQRPRPVRLFRRPEPIEDVLAPVPDDPPRRFRWRGRLHRVTRAEGPERLAEEWWRHEQFADVRTDQVRDYYRVEDETGARFWIFRAGLYDPQEPPKWWLHGLFG
ncbi:DNA polymerase Y family protein [Caulobacter sp. KR2-114]|uniref:Y-family DNA polymerase n=1 Tax=Caulobacter sp. KR2-114 TaxID=3400912 RepID=UPI003C0F2EC4